MFFWISNYTLYQFTCRVERLEPHLQPLESSVPFFVYLSSFPSESSLFPGLLFSLSSPSLCLFVTPRRDFGFLAYFHLFSLWLGIKYQSRTARERGALEAKSSLVALVVPLITCRLRTSEWSPSFWHFILPGPSPQERSARDACMDPYFHLQLAFDLQNWSCSLQGCMLGSKCVDLLLLARDVCFEDNTMQYTSENDCTSWS